MLAHRQEESSGCLSPNLPANNQRIAAPKQGREAVVNPTDPQQMAAEIARLDNGALLVSQGDFDVHIESANAIPHIVREIGRLREITFRSTGEGTGKSIDLDEFDSYYPHLFIWNRTEKAVVGAYRLGKSDLILRNLGLRGLYTRKLFAYRRQFLERITPALETGRSFVRHEYQRTYSPLLLPWRGISTYVSRNPRYRFLFGPVSISNDYHPGSRELIVTFLKKKYCRAADLAKLVRARNPFRARPVRWWAAGPEPSVSWDIEELSALVADIEVDRKGVPVLLKQYLKLGGKLVSFNVDAEFSNALDSLLVLALLQS
jgi:putative hemolysin